MAEQELIIAEAAVGCLDQVLSGAELAGRVRDLQLYYRDTVRYAAHKTILVRGWHRVSRNTEAEAGAADQVEFLD